MFTLSGGEVCVQQHNTARGGKGATGVHVFKKRKLHETQKSLINSIHGKFKEKTRHRPLGKPTSGNVCDATRKDLVPRGAEGR